jgi:hypothetical protein
VAELLQSGGVKLAGSRQIEWTALLAVIERLGGKEKFAELYGSAQSIGARFFDEHSPLGGDRHEMGEVGGPLAELGAPEHKNLGLHLPLRLGGALPEKGAARDGCVAQQRGHDDGHGAQGLAAIQPIMPHGAEPPGPWR